MCFSAQDIRQKQHCIIHNPFLVVSDKILEFFYCRQSRYAFFAVVNSNFLCCISGGKFHIQHKWFSSHHGMQQGGGKYIPGTDKLSPFPFLKRLGSDSYPFILIEKF